MVQFWWVEYCPPCGNDSTHRLIHRQLYIFEKRFQQKMALRKVNFYRQIMNGNGYRLLLTLFQNYSSLEKEIQERTNQISNHFCNQCFSKCCKEEICRESVESTFLSILVEKQDVEYDRKNGWISPSGCRLNYGRPLVCYEFFCEEIVMSSNFQASNIQQIIKEFISIGKRAHRNTHLICIDDLRTISKIKIAKFNNKMRKLMNKLTNL